jgi:hypothetical protein
LESDLAGKKHAIENMKKILKNYFGESLICRELKQIAKKIYKEANNFKL